MRAAASSRAVTLQLVHETLNRDRYSCLPGRCSSARLLVASIEFRTLRQPLPAPPGLHHEEVRVMHWVPERFCCKACKGCRAAARAAGCRAALPKSLNSSRDSRDMFKRQRASRARKFTVRGQ